MGKDEFWNYILSRVKIKEGVGIFVSGRFMNLLFFLEFLI